MNPLKDLKETEMVTQSDRVFDLSNPLESEVTIEDVAVHLSRLNRWTGARGPISVARHSLEVCYLLEMEGKSYIWRLAALLHDAHEAYMGDISRPVEACLGASVSRLKERIQEAVMVQIAPEVVSGVPSYEKENMEKAIKDADDRMLVSEFQKEDAFPDGNPFLPGSEYQDFIELYHSLKEKIHVRYTE